MKTVSGRKVVFVVLALALAISGAFAALVLLNSDLIEKGLTR